MYESNFHPKQYNGLTSKTCFLMEAHFKIMRLSLDSWNQNQLGGGLGFLFRPPVSSTWKSRKNLNWQFDLEKCDFWIFFKHTHAISQIERNRMRITNSGSVRQESALFVKKVIEKWRFYEYIYIYVNFSSGFYLAI